MSHASASTEYSILFRPALQCAKVCAQMFSKLPRHADVCLRVELKLTPGTPVASQRTRSASLKVKQDAQHQCRRTSGSRHDTSGCEKEAAAGDLVHRTEDLLLRLLRLQTIKDVEAQVGRVRHVFNSPTCLQTRPTRGFDLGRRSGSASS